MANTKEVKNHMKSVEDVQKITSAMYLISSTKMRKAKSELDQTRPYFDAVRAEIKRIFRTVPKSEIDSQYLYPPTGAPKLEGPYGYLVITADKGLAGAYNQNVIKETMRLMGEHLDNKLFVVGEYGRHFFASHHIPIEKSFLYTAQNPSLHRARDICAILLDLYQRKELVKIFIIYTDFSNGMDMTARSTRLLPFHRTYFDDTSKTEKAVTAPFEFVPSVEEVLDTMIPSYVTGFIYSALVDSFCSEQNARMTAMDSASGNAQKLLDDLSVQYNHVRQNAITQEITEISAGAKGQQRAAEGGVTS
jgi:F-type H+-transporting ATPase subunit gamma